MVDKNAIRAAFSARLHEALDDAGVRRRGRGVDVQKNLLGLGINRTTQAISKWLNSEAIAEADSMSALCSWLKVRREWLEYGVPPKKITDLPSTNNANKILSEQVPNERAIAVPLIDWQLASQWPSLSKESKMAFEDRIFYPYLDAENISYALSVRGDSMENTANGRSYPDGTIIFVDSKALTATGDKVIALLSPQGPPTFKVLVEDAGKYYLKPLNPQYPIIAVDTHTKIIGKVLGAFIKE